MYQESAEENECVNMTMLQHQIFLHFYSKETIVRNVADTEKEPVDLRLKEEHAKGEEKKKLKEQIKKTEESVNAMRVAKKSLNRFISSFAVGMGE